MGATLWELGPGAEGMRWHMHYGAEEMLFVLSGRPMFRTMESEEELAPATSSSVPRGGPACTPMATRTPSPPGSSP